MKNGERAAEENREEGRAALVTSSKEMGSLEVQRKMELR